MCNLFYITSGKKLLLRLYYFLFETFSLHYYVYTYIKYIVTSKTSTITTKHTLIFIHTLQVYCSTYQLASKKHCNEINQFFAL